jgi:hypothetical protein
MLINIFMKNVDETFRKNVESNVFSRKMLIQLFSEKCWLKNVGYLDRDHFNFSSLEKHHYYSRILKFVTQFLTSLKYVTKYV